jgi:hypothetical protein
MLPESKTPAGIALDGVRPPEEDSKEVKRDNDSTMTTPLDKIQPDEVIHCACGYTREWQMPCHHVIAVCRAHVARYGLADIRHFGRRWLLPKRVGAPSPSLSPPTDDDPAIVELAQSALAPTRQDVRAQDLGHQLKHLLALAGLLLCPAIVFVANEYCSLVKPNNKKSYDSVLTQIVALVGKLEGDIPVDTPTGIIVRTPPVVRKRGRQFQHHSNRLEAAEAHKRQRTAAAAAAAAEDDGASDGETKEESAPADEQDTDDTTAPRTVFVKSRPPRRCSVCRNIGHTKANKNCPARAQSLESCHLSVI